MPAASASTRHRPDPRLAFPRQSEATVLHAVVSGHVRTFLSRAEERGGVPRFVRRELLKFLDYGIPAHGFVRVHCKGCGHQPVRCRPSGARTSPAAPQRPRSKSPDLAAKVA